MTHENTQAPSVLLIHYCVWENSRNTQIPFQSVPLFFEWFEWSVGFSPAPSFFSFSFFSPPVASFPLFSCFLSCLKFFWVWFWCFSRLSLSLSLSRSCCSSCFFSSAFYFIPHILLILFLDVLTTGRVKSSGDLELMQALKYYCESQSEIVFPLGSFLFRPFFKLFYELVQNVLVLRFLDFWNDSFFHPMINRWLDR